MHSNDLSEQENKKVFGKCNHINGHGHNYVLEITLYGSVDTTTGVVINLTELKEVIRKEILDRMDHKHLNFDVPEFKNLNPTTENISIVIWDLLEKQLPDNLLYQVKIQETENNSAIYRGNQ